MPSLREKKVYHAVAKGCDSRCVGIYIDYNLMTQAVSGRATSKHLSCRTLKDAVEFMSRHDVSDPRIIFFNKEGQKKVYSVVRYESEILGIPANSPSSINHLEDAIIADLLAETLPLPLADDGDDISDTVINDLEMTIKECEKSVLSWDSRPDGKSDDVRNSTPLVTKTDSIRNISYLSPIDRGVNHEVDYEGSMGSMLTSAKSVASKGVQHVHIPSQVSAEVQVDSISHEQIDRIKSELATLKRQKKALLEEKDGLMKKNSGLRNANDILVKQNSKVSRLKKELSKVEGQKNYLVKEKQRLQRLLDEADCLLAANVLSEDSGFPDTTLPSSENTPPTIAASRQSPSTQDSNSNPRSTDGFSPRNALSGTIYYPPNLLPADLDTWLSTRMDTAATRSVEVPLSSSEPPATVPDPGTDVHSSNRDVLTANSSHDDLLAGPELDIWLSSQLPFLDRSLQTEDFSPEETQLSDPSLPAVKFRLGGSYPELSNLRHCRPWLRIYGKSFKSKDHAYQWRKAVFHNIPHLAEKIRRKHTAKQAMFIGRNITTTAEWKTKEKFTAMREINIAALEQDAGFRETLLSTGMRPLKEDTDHITWGHLNGGENKLGELYEQLRHQLRVNDANLTEDFQDRLTQLRDGPASNTENDQSDAPIQDPMDVPRIGLVFGDSNAQGVHPRLSNYIFRNVPIPGGMVCPDSARPHKEPLSHHLSLAMCGDEQDVTLMCGTNDAANADPTIFKQHYTHLVRTAGSKGAQVTCSSIYHRADRSTRHEVVNLNRRIDVLNEQIRDVANAEGAVYVDNCAEVGSSAEYPNTYILTRPKYGHQYLHLRDVAKRDLAFRIGKAIEAPQESNSRRQSPVNQQSSNLNPEAAPWVSRIARRNHLQREAEEARSWFLRTQEEYETYQARRRARFVPGASLQQSVSYPRDVQNNAQW